MGFFSWVTQDTKKSICNAYSGKGTFPVTMTDNKGNRWHEPNYDGYGVFGGKDYFELVAEMNGGGSREDGIFRECSHDSNVKNIARNSNRLDFDKDIFPNLTEDPNWEWVNEQPENCKYQGFFY